MIGNDVVDIALAGTQSNWRRKGYLNKLFTASEQELIWGNPNPNVTVWTLWSMKEAAYKIYNRQTGERGFFPLRLVCSLAGESGRVTCDSSVYHTKTEFKDNLIYTVAVADVSVFKNVAELHSPSILKDSSGLPYIKNDAGLHPVSISHHGRGYRVVGLV